MDGFNFLAEMAPPRSVLRKVEKRDEPALEKPQAYHYGILRALEPFPEAFVAVREALRKIVALEEAEREAGLQPAASSIL